MEIANKYNVSLDFVYLQLEKLKNWVEATGSAREDYKAELKNFVLRDLQAKDEYGSIGEESGND